MSDRPLRAIERRVIWTVLPWWDGESRPDGWTWQEFLTLAIYLARMKEGVRP